MKTGGEKPKVGFYKVMCFVAPSNNFGNSTGDFHWYKEISSIRYRTRPGDTLDSLGKFFRVRQAVLAAALAKAKKAVDANDGRVANDDQELRVLNKHVKMSKGAKIPAGKVIEFPVKLWSHKTGWAGGPLIVDASGKTITDPRKADRNYKPGFHYSKFCSAYGVRLGLAKTGNNSNRNGVAPRVNRVL
jgi:phage tail protein X